MKGTIWLALLLPILATAAQAADPVGFDFLVREIVKKGQTSLIQFVGEQPPGPHPTMCKMIDVETGTEDHFVLVHLIGDEVQTITFTSQVRHGYVVDQLQFFSDADGFLQSATTSFGVRDDDGITHWRMGDFQGLDVESKETTVSFQKELAFWRGRLGRR
jgi:hypothetical protein